MQGAALAGWASLFEARTLFRAFPYQTEASAWTSALPAYLGIGALIGLLAAVALPLFTRRKERDAQPSLHLGLLVIAACTLLVLLVEARFRWMSPSVRTTSGKALTTFAMVAGGVLAGYLVLYRVAMTRLQAAFNFLFKPVLGSSALLLLAIFAGVYLVKPTAPAKLSAEALVDAPAESPNVLLIVLDTLRADHLGTYGYHRATSPNLDAIAAEGVQFENAFSAAPWTLPSHASLFTGLHATTHGTGWEHPRLSDGQAGIPGLVSYDFHTLAEELGQRGYQTCGVSEKSWLSFDYGLTQGFEHYYDYSRPSMQETFFLQRLKRFGRRERPSGGEYPRAQDKGGERVVRTALDWLADGDGRDSSRPFFLFLNLNEAHHPYLPPKDYWGHFLPDGMALEDTLPDVLPAEPLNEHDYILGTLEMTPERLAAYISLYDDEILYQDMLLGRLFDGLQDLDLKEDTLIVVVADHGEEFAEIGTRVGHQLSLTDTLIRVPMVLRYPERLPAGKRVDSMASLVDLFPTIIDFIETHPSSLGRRVTRELKALEGVSLLGAMEGNAVPRDMILAHYSNPVAYLNGWPEWAEHLEDPLSFPLAPSIRSIDVLRTSEEKYFLYGDGARTLVQLAQDPTELNSELADVPAELQARARQFEDRLIRQLGSYRTLHEMQVGHMVQTRSRSAAKKTGGQSSQDLESLGYVGESSGDGTEATAEIVLPPIFQ